MAGGTSFGWRTFCSETNPFGRCAWRENDVVRRKTVAGRKDSPRCSPHYGTPVTPVTRKSVSGSAISILRLSLLTKLPDGYAGVGSIKTDTWTYFAPEYGRTPSPELSRSAAPAFKHTINVVANCVSGILAAQSPH